MAKLTQGMPMVNTNERELEKHSIIGHSLIADASRQSRSISLVGFATSLHVIQPNVFAV